jgi:radical SAM-linked protein
VGEDGSETLVVQLHGDVGERAAEAGACSCRPEIPEISEIDITTEPAAESSPPEDTGVGAGAGAGKTLRVFYEKREGACFVPHIALASLFARAARRAGIKPRLTDGFSPHVKMSFGPELPAGVVALSEPLDIWIDWREEELRAEENTPLRLAGRLNEQMPDGFRVVGCAFPPEGSAALGKACKAALYWVWAKNADTDEFSQSLRRHYGEDLLHFSVSAAGTEEETEEETKAEAKEEEKGGKGEGVRGFPKISFVVAKPAQNGIGGWVRALTADGAAGWQDLCIVRAALGRWNGARMEPLAEEGIACLRMKV